MAEQFDGPIETATGEPGCGETVSPMFCENVGDGGVIGLRRCGREGERDLAETEREKPIAAPRLAVIVTLRHGPRDDLDLAFIEAEAAVDIGDLRLEGALVRQEDPREAALDDGRRDRGVVDVGERLRGEEDGGVLLPQRLRRLSLEVAKRPYFSGTECLRRRDHAC